MNYAAAANGYGGKTMYEDDDDMPVDDGGYVWAQECYDDDDEYDVEGDH